MRYLIQQVRVYPLFSVTGRMVGMEDPGFAAPSKWCIKQLGPEILQDWNKLLSRENLQMILEGFIWKS